MVVTGPTASGKTPLALALAERFDGEIVNADSMQVFRFMDIGTAKPSAEERARVPHHLIDVVDPDHPYSAGRYARDARAAIARIHARRRLPLLVGGTGLYIRAVLHGLIADAEPDPQLRDELEAEQARAAREGDPTRLHRRLAEADPEAAGRIHPHDARRTVRALEIAAQTGARASQVRGQHAFDDSPYRVLHLALDLEREALYARIDARCRRMIDGGLLQEVRRLRERGYGSGLRPMGAIGYRHLGAVADGADTLANAFEAMCRDTRHFARRQLTWLRKVPDVVWVDPEDVDGLAARIEKFLAEGEDAAQPEL